MMAQQMHWMADEEQPLVKQQCSMASLGQWRMGEQWFFLGNASLLLHCSAVRGREVMQPLSGVLKSSVKCRRSRSKVVSPHAQAGREICMLFFYDFFPLTLCLTSFNQRTNIPLCRFQASVLFGGRSVLPD